MKKKFFAILLCGVMILGLTGCGATKNDFNVGEQSSVETKVSDVTLTLKEGTLTNTGATFILKNEGNIDYGYGPAWEIEMKQDDKWHKIDVVLNFNSPSYQLSVNESKELNINWENSYGKLASGEYRFIKHIDIEKEDGTFDDFYVSAEFTIE